MNVMNMKDNEGRAGGRSIITDPEIIRKNLRWAKDNYEGGSLQQALKNAGLNKGYINEIIGKKIRSNNPEFKKLKIVAEVLNVDFDFLVGKQNEPKRTPTATIPANVPLTAPPEITGIRVALVGPTDTDGLFVLEGAQTSHEILPAMATSDIQYVLVPDDTMAPRYRSGEVAFVSLKHRASSGNFALVRLNGGRATIREIIGIAPGIVRIRRSDNGLETELMLENILRMDRIVGSCAFS
jgi:hypothetical protein